MVLLRTPREEGSFRAELAGPYAITKSNDNGTYTIHMPEHPRRWGTYHGNLLERYNSPSAECLLTTALPEDDLNNLGPDPGGDGDDVVPPPGNHLSGTDKQRLLNLIEGYKDVLKKEPGRTTAATIRIETGSAYPIHLPAYRVSPYKLLCLEEEVKRLLETGLIQPSTSPWASPVIVVPKQDETVRLYVNYRKLNSVTVPDPFPMPLAEELIDRLGIAKIVTILDLAKGYYQVPVHKESVEKTAFVTPMGKYHFMVMPFGLAGAPAVFQRPMNTVLAGMTAFTAAYIDDVAVYIQTVDTHLEHLKLTLEKLRQYGLTAKPSKCQLARTHCTYLGHQVGGGEVKPLEAKRKALRSYPRPKTKKQLRAFLGLANYYRRFILHFAQKADPLNKTLKKDCPELVDWTPNRVDAFEELRRALTSESVLASPRMEEPFVLHTDASGGGIGVVLSQGNEEGQDSPVAFYSRQFKEAEAKYFVTEQECLAVIAGVRHYSFYLEGAPFTIVTDHHCLQYLDRMKDQKSRLTRWALILQPYHYKVEYRPGAYHQNADGLSRQTWEPTTSTPG